MALKGSQRRADGAPKAPSELLAETGFHMAGTGELRPIRLPEIMPSLRIRQMTPFGNMHVKVAVDPSAGSEREVFAQLGKGGDVANGRIRALADGLARALRRYLAAKKEHGLEALLLGRVPSQELAETSLEPRQSGSTRQSEQYKLKCPGCAGTLAFEEGCVKCYGCGFSQC